MPPPALLLLLLLLLSSWLACRVRSPCGRVVSRLAWPLWLRPGWNAGPWGGWQGTLHCTTRPKAS